MRPPTPPLTAAHPVPSYPLVFPAAVLTVVVGRYKPARFPRILVSDRKAGYGVCWYLSELGVFLYKSFSYKIFRQKTAPQENNPLHVSSDPTSHSRFPVILFVPLFPFPAAVLTVVVGRYKLARFPEYWFLAGKLTKKHSGIFGELVVEFLYYKYSR